MLMGSDEAEVEEGAVVEVEAEAEAEAEAVFVEAVLAWLAVRLTEVDMDVDGDAAWPVEGELTDEVAVELDTAAAVAADESMR